MKKALGVFGLLVAVCVLTALASEHFVTAFNIENLLRRSALFGLLGIGAAFVIVTGGIDLSIGSVVCLVGCLVPWLLVDRGLPAVVVVPAVLVLATLIGLGHGWLVTRLKLQPFLVTLCGLLLYRGIARGLTGDQPVGFGGSHDGLRALGAGRVPVPGLDDFAIPAVLIVLLVVAVLAAVFMNRTIWGRYLRAIGRNETAARYAGVNTQRMLLVAYGLCGALSGLGGLLFVLDVGSAQPADFGSFYELYAIAAAVLGGCSLRGGECTIVGVVLGAAVMQVLRNSITLVPAIPDNVEYAVIGAVILAGVVTDELVKRAVAARRARGQDPSEHAS